MLKNECLPQERRESRLRKSKNDIFYRGKHHNRKYKIVHKCLRFVGFFQLSRLLLLVCLFGNRFYLTLFQYFRVFMRDVPLDPILESTINSVVSDGYLGINIAHKYDPGLYLFSNGPCLH